jgi:membrane fusion protein, multidrug efflux system
MKVSSHVIVLLSIVFVISSCGTTATPEIEKTILNVEGYRVVAQPFNSNLTTTAQLMANEQVQLMAPISGQVLAIHFKEGQTVKRGDLLVHMDDRNWQAQLVGVTSELATAKKDLDRKNALLGIGGSSQVEVDQATTRVETLKSQLKQLQVNIDLAKINAPFSGRLGMRNFSQGAFLSQGEVITTLTDFDQLKVDFTISQAHGNSVEIGKKVAVMINGDTLSATIYAINPIIDSQTRTINARALMNQPKGKKIMPGTFAEVIISTDFVKDALLIPTQSIVPSITEQTVYLCKNGKAVRKIIEMGARTADMVQVLKGISAGDTVLTTGLLSVKEGMDLTIQSVK